MKISEFGQTTSFEANDYVGGYRGGENKRFEASQIAEYANAYKVYSVEFDNADLTSYTLTVQHNLSSRRIMVWWFDDDWVLRGLDGLLKMTDLNKFEVNFGSEIVGTHTLYYKKF